MWPLTIINVATYYYYFFLIFNFLNTPGSKDPRGKKLKKLKPGWNGYVPISYSARKVPWSRYYYNYYYFYPL